MQAGNLNKARKKEGGMAELTVDIEVSLASLPISLNDGSIRSFTI
jgi:hypothetical protein